jgi:hypothetical protein
MATKGKKKRANNCTDLENNVLCDVMDNYKSIIVDKRHDSKALAKKERAWKSIVDAFNADHEGCGMWNEGCGTTEDTMEK